jgi:two-component system NarL family response regulator
MNTLTRRELEVLRHLARGGSNNALAAALGLAPGTVKRHIHSILRKLGVPRRTMAVTVALRRGLIRLD